MYGPTFKDELHSSAQHSARGVLSMANSGKNTQASQFFILFKSARHLDGKHTVFGRVVGGACGAGLTARPRLQAESTASAQPRCMHVGFRGSGVC